jgi:hypothetical protein
LRKDPQSLSRISFVIDECRAKVLKKEDRGYKKATTVKDCGFC